MTVSVDAAAHWTSAVLFERAPEALITMLIVVGTVTVLSVLAVAYRAFIRRKKRELDVVVVEAVADAFEEPEPEEEEEEEEEEERPALIASPERRLKNVLRRSDRIRKLRFQRAAAARQDPPDEREDDF